MEFKEPSEVDLEKFQAALVSKDEMRDKQAKQHAALKIEEPVLNESQFANQCRIMLRMAR